MQKTSHGRINFHDRVTIINRLDSRIQRGEELMPEELEALFRLKEPVDEQLIEEWGHGYVVYSAVFKFHDKFYMAYYSVHDDYGRDFEAQVLPECKNVTKTIEVFEPI